MPPAASPTWRSASCDVPGHENFIKTMVAGACGMDGVILVVAADDGIMPQTREHLDILTLLGLRHGMVALTKIDRVDAARRQEVQAELAAFSAGRFSKPRPSCRCRTSPAKASIRFCVALEELVRAIPPRRTDGVFRLPLDRAFSAKGFGTIVAGIPIAGSASLGDEMVLLPHNITSRIKRIEVYGQPSDTVLAGQCAAINLGHCDAKEVRRGDVLTAARLFHAAGVLRLPVAAVAAGEALLEERRRGEVPHRHQRGQRHALSAGVGRTPRQRRAYRPTPHEAADRGRAGRPLHPPQFLARPHDRRRHDHRGHRAAVQAQPARDRCKTWPRGRRPSATMPGLSNTPSARPRRLAVSKADLARRTTTLYPAAGGDLVRPGAAKQKVLALGTELYLHRATAAEAGERLLDQLAEYHRRAPESPGMTWEQLGEACPWPKAGVGGGRAAVEGARPRGGEATSGWRWPSIGRPCRTGTPPHLEAVETLFPAADVRSARRGRAGREDRLPPAAVDRLLGILQEQQRLVPVGEGMFFHREAVEQARRLLVAHMREGGRLESVEFKYLVDTTRKFALPLLDYFDRIGVLRRVGNTRYLKTRPGGATGRLGLDRFSLKIFGGHRPAFRTG